MRTPRTSLVMMRVLAVILIALAFSGCRVEKIAPGGAGASAAAAGSAGPGQPNLAAVVAKMWGPKVLPYLRARAGDLTPLLKSLRTDPSAAHAAHGYRESGTDGPWSMVTTFTGRIVSVDTSSVVGRVGVDVTGNGQADVLVQIGPVIQGTVIRDSLGFISFNDYPDQIEFAELAEAFNKEAYVTALKGLSGVSLKGRTVTILGVFPARQHGLPVVTPVEFKLEARS